MQASNHLHEVALAGLLHDIGKFYGRSSEVVTQKGELKGQKGFTIRHPYYSKQFLQVIKDNIQRLDLDYNLLEQLVLKHHENPQMDKVYLVESLPNKDERLLALIVSRADFYSSRERREIEGGFPDYKKALMHSPFIRVNLKEKGQQKEQLSILEQRKLKPSNLTDFESLSDFAQKISPVEIQQVDQALLNKLVQQFANQARQIKATDFNQLFNSLLSLIFQFCWAISADSREKIRDVSLYDHLKTTSALATCLYIYHCEQETLNENAVKKRIADKFLLIGGDLSGIQKYLYDIANINAKAVAKRLRARSFRLTLLVESVAIYILKKLNLPASCLLFSSGGRFEILAPHTNTVIKNLQEIRRQLDKWLLEKYLGELSLNIAWQEFSPEDLNKFAVIFSRLATKMEQAKAQKFSAFLPFVNSPTFTVNYNGAQACSSCKKHPGTNVDQEDNEKQICEICAEDKLLGTKLSQVNFICFFPEGAPKEEALFKFNLLDKEELVVCLIKKKSSGLIARSYLSYLLFPQAAKLVDDNPLPALLKPLANWQPKDGDGYTFTFADLAANKKKATLEEEETGAKESETGFLGVIKADVDNLGIIFSHGLDEDLTMSRKSNLSTALDIFFGALVHIFAQEHNIYTVYSGGDDLLLIGKWDNIIDAAFKLNDYFYNFTGQHPHVTFSAGIAVTKPKTPIWFFAQKANDLLEQSKERNKNSLTCFGATFSWRTDLASQLNELKDLFTQNLEQDTISTGFVYQFLNWQRQYIEAKKPFYKPQLAYQLARNLSDDNPEQARLKELLVDRLLEAPESDELLSQISYPVSFALLSERLREKEEKNE